MNKHYMTIASFMIGMLFNCAQPPAESEHGSGWVQVGQRSEQLVGVAPERPPVPGLEPSEKPEPASTARPEAVAAWRTARGEQEALGLARAYFPEFAGRSDGGEHLDVGLQRFRPARRRDEDQPLFPVPAPVADSGREVARRPTAGKAMSWKGFSEVGIGATMPRQPQLPRITRL